MTDKKVSVAADVDRLAGWLQDEWDHGRQTFSLLQNAACPTGLDGANARWRLAEARRRLVQVLALLTGESEALVWNLLETEYKDGEERA